MVVLMPGRPVPLPYTSQKQCLSLKDALAFGELKTHLGPDRPYFPMQALNPACQPVASTNLPSPACYSTLYCHQVGGWEPQELPVPAPSCWAQCPLVALLLRARGPSELSRTPYS